MVNVLLEALVKIIIDIWALCLSPCKIMLQLVKIEVLDPSLGVLFICLDINFLQICKIQVWRIQDLKVPNSGVSI